MRKAIISCLAGLFFLMGCSISRDVSVLQMRDKAKFETYTFSVNPAWTNQSQITGLNFFGSNTFISAYYASDGRHIVLAQSETYKKKLSSKIHKGQLIYTSPNGFKVWAGCPKKCYCACLLKSARHFIKDVSANDCIGYALESSTGVVLMLAINGQLTDEELHSLVDSLVPAEEYQNLTKGDNDE